MKPKNYDSAVQIVDYNDDFQIIYVDKGWVWTIIINDQVWPSFAWQVLEYHPEPWDKWTNVGNILIRRRSHAVHSVGHKQLPCLSGELACGMSVECG